MNEEKEATDRKGKHTFGSLAQMRRGSRCASQVVTREEMSVRKAELDVSLG